ncbi:MAG: rod shape-determining protein MreC [Tangfeifania sp.]
MRSLLRYLLKNYAFVLFLFLEGVALSLLFTHNSYQRSKYLNSSNRITGNIYEAYNSVVQYFHLTEINKNLAEENAELRTLLENQAGIVADDDSMFISLEKPDTLYRFTPARVINNSVNRSFNYFTLNKGLEDGIESDQGVLSGGGIVGVVTQVSESYAVGISVLNSRWSVSAMVKKNGYYGSLIWRGENYRLADLTEIPLHVDISPGDSVVTSGYSSIFPEGIMIGTIQDFSRPSGENYYSIKVKLSTDFKNLSYVEVIENQDRPEIDKLENIITDDPMAN